MCSAGKCNKFSKNIKSQLAVSARTPNSECNKFSKNIKSQLDFIAKPIRFKCNKFSKNIKSQHATANTADQ